MVSPSDVNDFCIEMTQAKADWQVHLFGNTQHSFTNPKANNNPLGTVYNPLSNKRSMNMLENFLNEIFSES